MIDSKAVGKRIKARREDLGLTQEEVGKRLGLDSGQQVSRWEGGGMMSVENLADIATILNDSVDRLLAGKSGPSPTAEAFMHFAAIRQAVTEYHVARRRGVKPTELAGYRRIVVAGVEHIVGSVQGGQHIIESFTRLLLDAGEPMGEQVERSGATGGHRDA